jgi:hypothetical protein
VGWHHHANQTESITRGRLDCKAKGVSWPQAARFGRSIGHLNAAATLHTRDAGADQGELLGLATERTSRRDRAWRRRVWYAQGTSVCAGGERTTRAANAALAVTGAITSSPLRPIQWPHHKSHAARAQVPRQKKRWFVISSSAIDWVPHANQQQTYEFHRVHQMALGRPCDDAIPVY